MVNANIISNDGNYGPQCLQATLCLLSSQSGTFYQRSNYDRLHVTCRLSASSCSSFAESGPIAHTRYQLSKHLSMPWAALQMTQSGRPQIPLTCALQTQPLSSPAWRKQTQSCRLRSEEGKDRKHTGHGGRQGGSNVRASCFLTLITTISFVSHQDSFIRTGGAVMTRGDKLEVKNACTCCNSGKIALHRPKRRSGTTGAIFCHHSLSKAAGQAARLHKVGSSLVVHPIAKRALRFFRCSHVSKHMWADSQGCPWLKQLEHGIHATINWFWHRFIHFQRCCTAV